MDDGVQCQITVPKKSLTAMQLVGVLFVATIGGAYGIEEGVQTGGGFGMTIGVLLAPWIWGLPTAMVVSELATALPSNAGPILWISKVAPDFITFCFVIFTILANIVDNSIYPNLLVAYFNAPPTAGASVSTGVLSSIFIKFMSILAAASINVFSIDTVGAFGAGFMILTIAPFILLFFSRLSYMSELTVLLPKHIPDHINWGKFVPILTWNIAGIDSVGNLVEEIEDPKVVLFPSLVVLIILSQVTYVLPILAAVTLPNNSPELWVTGSWIGFAYDAAGDYLRLYIQMAGMLSSFGFLTTLLCTTSRALQGIAAMGFVPVFQRLAILHPKYRTPVNSIIVTSVVTFIVSSATDFIFLVEVGQLLYMTRLIAIFVSAFLIRIREPSLHRPFSVPGGIVGILLAVCIPSVYSLCTMIISLDSTPLAASMFSLIVLLTLFLSLSIAGTVGFKSIDVLSKNNRSEPALVECE